MVCVCVCVYLHECVCHFMNVSNHIWVCVCLCVFVLTCVCVFVSTDVCGGAGGRAGATYFFDVPFPMPRSVGGERAVSRGVGLGP